MPERSRSHCSMSPTLWNSSGMMAPAEPAAPSSAPEAKPMPPITPWTVAKIESNTPKFV